MKMNKNFKKAMLFIELTFPCSWLMAILFFVFGGKSYTSAFYVMGISYMFVPMIMAIVVQKFIFKEPLKKPLGISFKLNRWFLVAWLLPPIITVAAAIIHGSFNGTYGLALVVVKGGSDLTVGVTGLAGFIALACVNIGLLVYDRFLTKNPIMVR